MKINSRFNIHRGCLKAIGNNQEALFIIKVMISENYKKQKKGKEKENIFCILKKKERKKKSGSSVNRD